jgi:hypothetical protein
VSRKTPVLLRRGPLSGDVNALLRYTRTKSPGGVELLKASEKQDVTADFDALMLEELFGRDDDSPNIVAILDGVADGQELNAEERAEVRAFRERLAAACERHNKRQVPA